MSKFDGILELEEALKTDKYEEMISNGEHNDTADNRISVPVPIYTETVRKLIRAVNDFHRKNPDYDLVRFQEILEENGYDLSNMDNVAEADDKCIMAMFMFVVSRDRFFDGLILYALKSGMVFKWIERLRQISES